MDEYSFDEAFKMRLQWSLDIFKMLGNRTPSEFMELPKEKRKAIYTQELVKPKPTDILLRSLDRLGRISAGGGLESTKRSNVEKSLRSEANKIYYEKNSFSMKDSCLDKFIYEHPGEERLRLDLVGKITVQVTLRETNGRGPSLSGLQLLEKFVNAEEVFIDLVLCEKKAIAESFPEIRETIRVIAKVVKQVIEKLDDGVVKVRIVSPTFLVKQDVTRYWATPSDAVRSNFEENDYIKFHQRMQLLVEEWIAE